MKKIIAFTTTLIIILTVCLNIAYGFVNSINNVTVDTNYDNKKVTIQGNINTGTGKNVTLQVLDPDASVENIGQVISSQDGKFIFSFTANSIKVGDYTARIGGEGIVTPYEKSFKFTSTTPTTTTGGSTGGGISPGTPAVAVTVPVTTTTDGNSNVVGNVESSNIDKNTVNVIKVQELTTDGGAKVNIPASVIGRGTGSIKINTGSVVLDIPISLLDSSILTGGAFLQVSKSILSSVEAKLILQSIPQGVKSNGKVFNFSMDILDSNNKVVGSIHNFASGKNITVTLNISSDDIKGMNTSNISAFYYDTTNKTWIDMGGSYNKTAATYSFNTTHFTDFAILEKAGTASDNVKRLAGQNRIETSIAIAKEEFNGTKPDAVVLTTANDFPDALTGSGVAYKYNAPLLLVNKSVSDSKSVLDYITSNLTKDKNIYILGGTGVVSTEISDYLTSNGYTIVRLSGADRYETNQKIVDNLKAVKGTPIVIATGNGFADALSISSIADIKGYTVLLNGKDTLSANVSNNITNMEPTTIYLVGGTGVLSSNIEAQIRNLNATVNIVRLGGENRYETSMIILDYFKLTTSTITVATGTDFPDALSGSVLAARKNSGILLVNNNDITKQKALLVKENITNTIVLGGEAAIRSDIANSLIQK